MNQVLAFFKLLNELLLLPILRWLNTPKQPGSSDAIMQVAINLNQKQSAYPCVRRVTFGDLEVRTYETILGE